jgi:hypothetical protein
MAELMFFNPAEAFARGQGQAQALQSGGMQNALLGMQLDEARNAPQRMAQRNALIQRSLQTGNTTQLFVNDPDTGAKVQSYLASLDEQGRAEFDRKHTLSSKLLATVKASQSPEQTYMMARDQINSIWGQEVMPAQYDPNAVDLALASARSVDDILKPQATFVKPESELRKEYSDLVKPFNEQKRAYGRIRASAKDPSAAGDLALIFNYMKLLDPGSVVRETEFATAQNATGVPDQIRNVYNRVLNGERLGEAQRGDFVDRASRLFNDAVQGHNEVATRFQWLAQQYGLSPANIAQLWQPVEFQRVEVQEPPRPDALKPGMTVEDYRYKGGDPSKPESWVKVDG